VGAGKASGVRLGIDAVFGLGAGVAPKAGTGGVASKASTVAWTLATMVASGSGMPPGAGVAAAARTASATAARMVASMSGV
jgi:hypothetical protein